MVAAADADETLRRQRVRERLDARAIWHRRIAITVDHEQGWVARRVVPPTREVELVAGHDDRGPYPPIATARVGDQAERRHAAERVAGGSDPLWIDEVAQWPGAARQPDHAVDDEAHVGGLRHVVPASGPPSASARDPGNAGAATTYPALAHERRIVS